MDLASGSKEVLIRRAFRDVNIDQPRNGLTANASPYLFRNLNEERQLLRSRIR
jgi:hypothetical protein